MDAHRRQVRYFVSYASEDGELKDKLLEPLETLFKASASYEFLGWQDRLIPLGVDWHQEIQKAARGADFGLLLLSPDFFASEYIREHELPVFRSVIPVALRAYPQDGSIRLQGLERLQVFWHEDNAFDAFVNRWSNRDRVVQELFARINQRLKDDPVSAATQAAVVAAPAMASVPGEVGALIAQVRAAIPELTRRCNGHRLPEALTRALDQFEQAIGDSQRLPSAAAALQGLDRVRGELERKNYCGCFRLGLGELAARLGALMPQLKAAPRVAGEGVTNDWDTDPGLAQAQEIPGLLERIDQRLELLARPLPGLDQATREAMRAELIRLEGLLRADPLHLAELDACRAALERLDRDLFALLIETCQVVLGYHAVRLPPGAVFRDRLRDGSAGPELVVIPAGRFRMGSPEDEAGRNANEGPLHEVEIPLRFGLGRVPVTFEEYDRFVAAREERRPHEYGGRRGLCPVIDVSWVDAQEYLRWLIRRSGQEYRLPSEAEWEYACRAGCQGRWCFGDDEWQLEAYAWYRDNSDHENHPVKEKFANIFGLLDMHGNVWELVEDSWCDNYIDVPTDRKPWDRSVKKYHVLRGGSWTNSPAHLRSANRDRAGIDDRFYNIGFRVARTF